MTFKDLIKFMKKNEDLYIITDTKYADIEHIKIEFDEMRKILDECKGVNERLIIEIYNVKMFFFKRTTISF